MLTSSSEYGGITGCTPPTTGQRYRRLTSEGRQVKNLTKATFFCELKYDLLSSFPITDLLITHLITGLFFSASLPFIQLMFILMTIVLILDSYNYADIQVECSASECVEIMSLPSKAPLNSPLHQDK